jgi:Tfp pilus assembly protein PilO
MSYALRNTLIFALLLVLVIGGGGYWVFFHQKKELVKVEQRIVTVKGELETIGDVNAALAQLTAKLEAARERWRNLSKIIPPEDDPAETYAYLNQIMSAKGSAVTFNFMYKESGGNDALKWNRYQITEGAGTYGDLHGFLWRLEHQRRLYGIKKLGVVELRSTDETTGKPISRVAFDMELDAYVMPGVENVPSLAGQFVEFKPLSLNPFRPLIYEDLPPNKENLVEVDKSVLMGISGNVIYLRDHQKKSRTLNIGDRVYLGRLDRVDPLRGRAVFALNKGGVGETVVLSLTEPAETGEGE